MKASSSRGGLGVRGKLIGLLVGTAFIALLLTCAAFVFYDRVTYMASKRSTLSVLTDSVAQSAYGPTAFQDPDSAMTILKVLEAEPTALGGAIYTKDGARLATWNRAGSSFELPATSEAAAQRAPVAKHLALHREVGKDGTAAGELHVEFSTHDVDARTRSFLQIAGAVLVISVLLALGLATISQRVFTRPIALLAGAAARVQKDQDFAVRAERVSDDELGSLTDAFNEMLSGIQARDDELEGHRTNLEALIAARTEQLAARNEAMRLVLDNVEQGLAMVDVAGRFDPERSAAFDRLVGTPAADVSFTDLVGASDETLRGTLKLGWELVNEDVFPLDVALDLLPKRMKKDDAHYTLGFKAILDKGGKFNGALLVVTDVTSEVEGRLEQERQGEFLAVFERVMHDRDGFFAFSKETSTLLDKLGEGAVDPKRAMALLHTVKGNSAQWGVSSVAKIAHALETQVVESDTAPTADQIATLSAAWTAITGRVETLVGGKTDRLELTRADVDAILADVRAREPYETIADRIERLKHEPTAVRFGRMAEDVERLSTLVGKPEPAVVIESNGVRLPASRFGSFWASTVHVVRNMMDHGIEPAEARVTAGKSEAGTIVLTSTASADQFTIEFQDDGRGIDWNALAVKAREAGLRAETRADLEAALFASGVSTATEVTDLSGRGVGLSAVAERCAALGGTVRIISEPRQGSRFVFSFPRSANEHSIAPAAMARIGHTGEPRPTLDLTG